jgi:hypothetical protein
MSKVRMGMVSAVAVMACGLWGVAAAQEYDKSFLSDYSKLQATPLPNNAGTDLVYIPPGVFERLGKYNSVLVDEPEVLISPNSDYKGAKPEDLLAVAQAVRTDFDGQLTAGGYKVVDAPGPGVIYVKMAVTDLSLKRKKRGILGYTPIGFVVKAGADALRDMMQKYDIMGMTIQAELLDSQSNEVLAQVVALRGAVDQSKRMDFDQLNAAIKDFGSRVRCRLDNAHVPAAEQINCTDPAARQAREASKTKP